MEGILAFRQAVSVLPPEYGSALLALPEQAQRTAEEVRLRSERPPTVLLPEGERPVPGAPVVTGTSLAQLVERASRWSLHAVLEQLRRGYLTLEGGHRLGLCGAAVTENGRVIALRDVTSADLRISRLIRGEGEQVADALCRGGAVRSALILAPPGAGKTTLLRDLICRLSDGTAARPGLRVAVADERGEIAGPRGRAALGTRTDVLAGCPKATAVGMLLRAMSPQVIAVDEITAPEDVEAMAQAAGCGAALLATAHAAGPEDLHRRPLYRRIAALGIFPVVVTIRTEAGRRRLEITEMEAVP